MLTEEQIAQFHRDGFLKIPKVFDGEELEALRAATDRVELDGIARRDPDHLYQIQPDGREQYFRSEKMWERDPVFRAVTVKPALLCAIGQCLGHPFMPGNDSLVAKQPRSNTPIPWHQDPPYIYPKPPQTFGIPNFDTDIYLDHATIANGCLYGLPGRHLFGSLDLSPFRQEDLFGMPDAIPMEMEPGDVLFHCPSAPHGSRANPTDTKRRIFYLHYTAREVQDQFYQYLRARKGDQFIGFDSRSVDRVRQFIVDRQQLGWETDFGEDLELTAEGFVFRGQPATPPWYWQQLIEAMPPDVDRSVARINSRKPTP